VNGINDAARRHNQNMPRSRKNAFPSTAARDSAVYRDHFHMRERPFTQAPGQRFFTANATVDEVLERLGHVLSARDGIALLTGGPGVGKTTLVERAIGSVADQVTVARVDLRYGEAEDLYAAILLALGEEAAGLRPVQALYALRHVMGRHVREEQRLLLCLDLGSISTEVAKHLLRIANLAGEHDCQMNIVLMGPHTLHQQLDLPALIQLRQRVMLRHRVRPLTLAETDRYMRQQVDAVGGDVAALISNNFSAAVYCYVAGVPRLINTLVDAVFADAALQEQQRPESSLVRRTAEQLGWKPITPKPAADAAARTAAVARSSPPRVAPIATATPERQREARLSAAPPPAEPRRIDLPPPSEATLQLRKTAAGDPGTTGRYTVLSLASEPRSPTAGIFGTAEGSAPAARTELPPPAVAMDATDTGATGMLRLQDLDDRFAETIFGREGEEAARNRN
jgi:general secretion pathway protein A